MLTFCIVFVKEKVKGRLLSQTPLFYFQCKAPIQLVVPNAVIAAVMMLAITALGTASCVRGL